MPSGKSLSLEQHEEIVELKTAEKVDKLPEGLSAETLKLSLNSYKGKFTSAINKANSNIVTFEQIGRDEYTENWRTILYNDKDDINIYKNVLEWIFQNYLQVCEDKSVAEAEKSAAEINQRWLKSNSLLTAAISKVEGGLQVDAKRHELDLAKAKAAESVKNDSENNPAVPKIASSLRPEPLDLAMNPVKFNNWLEKFGEFIRGNKISNFSKPDQISYAKTLISDELWTLLKSKINENTQAAVFAQGKVTLLRDANGHDTFVGLLAQEWLRQYPLSTRRLELFKSKQLPNESTITWLSTLEQQFEAANVLEMTPQLFMIYFGLHGIYDQELQKEAIKGFEEGKVKTISDLKTIVRTEEVTSRTSDYMKGKSEHQAYMTDYKRNKNKSHNQQRNSKDQKGQKGQRGQKGQNQRYNRSQSRGRRGKYCTWHRSTTHNTEECKAKKASQGQERGRSRERRRRSPSPAYNSGSGSSRSPSPNKVLLVQNKCNYTIKGRKGRQSLPKLPFTFLATKNGKPRHFKVPCYGDTGSSRSILSLKTAKAIGLHIRPAPNDTLSNASNEYMKVNGRTFVTITLDGKIKVEIDALVSEDLDNFNESTNLISWHDLEALKLVDISRHASKQDTIKETKIDKSFATKSKETSSYDKEFPPLPKAKGEISQNSTKLHSPPLDIEKLSCVEIKKLLIDEYSDVITDILPAEPMKVKPYVIEVNPEKVKKFPPKPAILPRIWPLHMEKQCEEELDSLEEQGIIRKLRADETTDYVAQSMFVRKKDPKANPRLVTDHTSLNLNVDRPLHPINSPHSLMERIPNDAVFWLGADLLKGYNQIPIAKESQPLTAFITPKGRYCWQRASMGMCISGDIFGIATDLLFQSGLEGQNILKCVDDVAFSARTKSGLYQKAKTFLEICRQNNVAISKKKLQLGNSIDYCGHHINKNKISIDKDRVKAIESFPCPSSIPAVRSYCGLAQTFAKHHPDLAMALTPLRLLLKKGNAFMITPEIKKAFEDSKKILCNTPILSAFEKGRKTILVTDASLEGFGFCLLQESKTKKGQYYLIKAGSKATKPHQKTWAVNELELEGIRTSLKDCSFYLRGIPKADLVVVNDHRIIGDILRKPLPDLVSPRHVRCRLDIQQYDFSFQYMKGTQKLMLISDLLSRRPCWSDYDKASSLENCDIEEFSTCNVALMISQLHTGNTNMVDTVTPLFLQNLAKATKEDVVLQIISSALEKGQRFDDIEEKDKIHGYRQVFDDLSVDEYGLVIRGESQICVPKAFQAEVQARLHAGHPGLVKAKAMARMAYFYPSLMKDLTSYVTNCQPCQMYMRSNPVQKVEPEFQNPDDIFAMSHVASDILQIGKNYFIVSRDRYSGFIICKRLNNTTSQSIINALQNMCLNYGYMSYLSVDNAKNISGFSVQKWAKDHGVEIINPSAYFSRSSGLVESACGVCRRLYLKSKNYEQFKEQLLDWNCLPRNDNPSVSPAELFLGRRPRTNGVFILPKILKKGSIPNVYKKRIDSKLAEYKKLPGKNLPDLKINDVVRIQDPISKLWKTTGIIEKKIRGHSGKSSSYIVLIGGTKRIHRNKRFLRRIDMIDHDSSFSGQQSAESAQVQKTANCNETKKSKVSILKKTPELSPGYFGPAQKTKRRSKRLHHIKWAKTLSCSSIIEAQK